MFDYLEANAYRELMTAIMTIIDTELEERVEHDDYYFGKMEVLSKILDRIKAIDNALHEEIIHQLEELDQYYKPNPSADESHSNQL